MTFREMILEKKVDIDKLAKATGRWDDYEHFEKDLKDDLPKAKDKDDVAGYFNSYEQEDEMGTTAKKEWHEFKDAVLDLFPSGKVIK